MKKETRQAEEPVNRKKEDPAGGKVSWGERVNNYICPMLLGGVICFIIIYALYRPLAVQYTAIFAGEQLLLFMLFDKLKKRKIFGGIMYTLMMVAVVFFSMYLLFNGAMSAGFSSPVTWFYGDEGSYSYRPNFLNAVFIGGGFFLISILYYFTQIRYRSLGVMLTLLFPLVIYAKRADAMPDILVTLMISFFLSVMVHNRRLDPSIDRKKRGVLVINIQYLISMAVFVSVTGAITMMIDKPTYFSKIEQDSSYFDYYQTEGTGSGDFSSLTDQSSARRGGIQYTNNPVFYFETNGKEDEYFLRRQSFNYFNGSVWENTVNLNGYAYSSSNPEYGMDDISADMETVSAASGDLPSPKGLNTLTERTGRVFAEDFFPQYLPAPLGVVTDRGEVSGLAYLKYPSTAIIRAAVMEPKGLTQLNDQFVYWEQNSSLMMYAHQLAMTGESYTEKLTKISEKKGASEEAVKAAKRLLFDYEEAAENYLDISKTEDRLVKLAWDITADCNTDIEKAQALERYFENSGFVYSLDYVPPDDSIEYFVFESKTGYCSSFATAMTIMARSVNLPARYVEGFAAFERTEDEDTMVVRDGHSHAFVEVYIPGNGWLTFDPTVPDYRTQSAEEESSFNMELFLRILSRFIVVIIVAFFIIFILLLDRIIEFIFRLRLSFAEPAKRVIMLYRNVLKLVNFSSKEDHSAFTVKMLREYLTETRTVVPEVLFDLFERTAFGGYSPSKAEADEAYRDYRHCYKYLRRLPRPRELAKLKGIPYKK